MRKWVLVSVAVFLIIFPLTNNVVMAADEYSSWAPQIALPFNIASNQTAIINGNLYNFGGGDSQTFHSEILSSHIFLNGTLDTWTIKGNLPISVTWHSISKSTSYIYLIGGAIPDPSVSTVSSTDSVYVGKILSDGSISDWSVGLNLPKKLARGVSFIYNNRIYYAGGLIHLQNSSETVSSSVYSSEINTDGTISSWRVEASLPEPLAEFAIYQQDNMIFVLGGMKANASPANTVYKGIIDNLGQIQWIAQPTLQTGLRRPAFTTLGNKVYLIGGYNGQSFTNTVYVSELDASSNLSNWQILDIQTPHGNCCNSAASYNGRIYLVGGHDGVDYYNDVLRTEIINKNELLVPNYKQYDPIWKNLEYDTAHTWAPSNKISIERWGCALTSAAMILSYYGHKITPDQLNTYLLTHNGYTRNGGVIWGKISKYSKDHETSVLPSLEFSAKNYSNNDVDSSLAENKPAIIKLLNPSNNNTHFIVLKGKQNSDYLMNDPASTQLLFSYYNPLSYKKINTFTPSHTDLSSISLYVNKNITMKVFDPTGNQITEGYDTEYPFEDQVTHTNSSVETLNSFLLSKPQVGTYKVELAGNSAFKLDSYIFDINGNSVDNNLLGDLKTKPKEIFLIQIGNNQIIQKVSFSLLLETIDKQYQLGHVKTKLFYKTLKTTVENAEKQYPKKIFLSKSLLQLFMSELNIANTKLMTLDSKKELKNLTNLLLQTI